ncbi:MAG TPA: transglycosylase family protein [Trebonia sp.]|nr:transglycosylase family protein [Trebonia sp.]
MLIGAAAAFALAGAAATPAQASVSMPGAQAHAQATAPHAATPVAALLLSARGPAATQTAAARPVQVAKHDPASAARYAIKSGDSLSSIAEHFYQSTAYWPVLYWANHGHIQYANDIDVGQILTIPVKPARIPHAPSALSPAPAQTPAVADATTAPHYTVRTAVTLATPAQAAPAQAAPEHYADTSAGGDSSFQRCVITRESGGNSQAVGAGGYYGLYQFSAPTWAEYGGNPADFGNASAAEQNRVFDNAIAAGGESNWSSYDGC